MHVVYSSIVYTFMFATAGGVRGATLIIINMSTCICISKDKLFIPSDVCTELRVGYSSVGSDIIKSKTL